MTWGEFGLPAIAGDGRQASATSQPFRHVLYGFHQPGWLPELLDQVQPSPGLRVGRLRVWPPLRPISGAVGRMRPMFYLDKTPVLELNGRG